MGLFQKDLLSINQLTKGQILSLLKEAGFMLDALKKRKRLDTLGGMIMATLFFEPSTRTRLSFESAMQRLGGGVLGIADANTSSMMKGESLEDTIKVVSAYADIIVLRHPDQGAAKTAAGFADIPVINAGDGAGQHPTQALMDLFTIKSEKKKLEGLKVALVGDLKYARSSHSLAYGLALFGNDLTLIAPKSLQMETAMVNDLSRKYGIEINKSDSLESALDADVVYIPRVQKERFPNLGEYQKFADYYRINREFLSKADSDIIIMSPLPRLTEISKEIDKMKNAVYFKQAANGVPVRMAILKSMLTE